MNESDLMLKLHGQKNLSNYINGTKFSYDLYEKLINILHRVAMMDDSELKNIVIVAFRDS